MENLYDSANFALQVEKVIQEAKSFQKCTQTGLDTALSTLFDAWSGEEADAFF